MRPDAPSGHGATRIERPQYRDPARPRAAWLDASEGPARYARPSLGASILHYRIIRRTIAHSTAPGYLEGVGTTNQPDTRRGHARPRNRHPTSRRNHRRHPRGVCRARVTATRTVGSCAACGTRFTAATGTRGRPRVTCSDPCRTAYEAVQRAVKALDAIEIARPHSRARTVRRLAELLTDAG